jgi:putative addiction module component (TIGR02574 family)
MASISLSDILQLSVAERLRLVGEIWDSIASEPEALPLTEAQRIEILRRSEAHRTNPQEAIPLSDDKGDPEGRLSRLERQGILRRAAMPLPREILMDKLPRATGGASVLEALLAERRNGSR